MSYAINQYGFLEKRKVKPPAPDAHNRAHQAPPITYIPFPTPHRRGEKFDKPPKRQSMRCRARCTVREIQTTLTTDTRCKTVVTSERTGVELVRWTFLAWPSHQVPTRQSVPRGRHTRCLHIVSPAVDTAMKQRNITPDSQHSCSLSLARTPSLCGPLS